MPIASSQYWNAIHGRGPGEAVGDAEGIQTMRVLARNMTFLMKSIELGKEKYGLPEKEEVVQEKNDIGRKLCDESAETGKSDQKVCAL